jgi:hypothetical protein
VVDFDVGFRNLDLGDLVAYDVGIVLVESVALLHDRPLMVYDLAKRAERHGDPYENLQAMYHFAEVSWAKGDYELIKNGRNQRADAATDEDLAFKRG